MKINQKVSENPFYGKKELLNMFNTLHSKPITNVYLTLSNAWKECTTLEDKELFFSLFFSVGDITNRNHNLFQRLEPKVQPDNGGHAARAIFRECLRWLLTTEEKTFYSLLPLIPEYTNIENLFYNQLRTDRFNTKSVLNPKGKEVIHEIIPVDINKVAKYISLLLKSGKLSQVEEIMWQKFLSRPALSTKERVNKKGEKTGRRSRLPETKKRQQFKIDLIKALSKEMKWEYIHHNDKTKNKYFLEFKGFNEWKQKYDDDIMNLTQAKMFSSHKIKQLDKTQFHEWLNRQPSGANYRVRRMLLDKDDKDKGKWMSNFGFSFATAYLEWEKFKSEKQQQVRVVEQKIKMGTATEKERVELEENKKLAKVNVAGENLFDMINAALTGGYDGKEADLKLDAMLAKMKFEVPCLYIGDVSGSMSGYGGLPQAVSQLLATVILMKNPDPELGNLLIRFGTNCDVITGKVEGEVKSSKFMQGKAIYVDKLIDPKLTFIQNWFNVGSLLRAKNEGTNLSSITIAIKKWVDEEESEIRKELLQKYQVLVIGSDGAFNTNAPTNEAALRRMQMEMLQWFGWQPVIYILDVMPDNERTKVIQFDNLENVIHDCGWNPGIINTVFSNLHDLDIIDVYTPLQAIHRSNRYQPVRGYVQRIYGKSKRKLEVINVD